MSIKAKQVAGVTTLVVLVVAVLSAYHLATLARLRLEDSEERGQMLAQPCLEPGPLQLLAGANGPGVVPRHCSRRP